MIPPLPSLRALTAELRDLHEAWSHPDAGGEYAVLVCVEVPLREVVYEWRAFALGSSGTEWVVRRRDGLPHVYGREWVPGSLEIECANCFGRKTFPTGWPCSQCHGLGRVHVPTPFDAVAAARRLLAAARDGLRSNQPANAAPLRELP